MKGKMIIELFKLKYPAGTLAKCLVDGKTYEVSGTDYVIANNGVGAHTKCNKAVVLGNLLTGEFAEIVKNYKSWVIEVSGTGVLHTYLEGIASMGFTNEEPEKEKSPIEICKERFSEGVEFYSLSGAKAVSSGDFKDLDGIVLLYGKDRKAYTVYYNGLFAQVVEKVESNLEKAARLYPKGTRFLSAATDCEFESTGSFTLVESLEFKGNITGSMGGVVFNNKTGAWAKVVEDRNSVLGLSDDLCEAVLLWAKDKGIVKGENAKAQFVKIIEEVGEMGGAMLKGNRAGEIDGLGDTLVTLIIYAGQRGLNLNECLQVAYNEIKNRKGKTVDGSFIKD